VLGKNGWSCSIQEIGETGEGVTLSERIKASVAVLEFVSQYVDLKPTASGAVGLCPFHDDHHPSFGVNEEGNYGNCFAGCGGGSVIDFWMKWRGCDFTIAGRELSKMVL
jgi:DNA primase